MKNIEKFLIDVEQRLSDLENGKEQIEYYLGKCPGGRLHIAQNKGRVQFYIRSEVKNGEERYLSKKDAKRCQVYVQKQYYEKCLKLISYEIKQLRDFLIKYGKCDNQLKELYSRQSNEIKQYINPIDMSDDDYAKMWLQIPYETKIDFEKKAELMTEQGEWVRSKSELNIANALFKMKIPYKYECPLTLNTGLVVHPDFTVLNKITRQEMYWEHRGMMDDREYVKHSVVKLKEYEKSGYLPGQNIIITEETSSCLLGTKEIYDVINAYLL